MSKFKSLNGRLDANGILALASENTKPHDDVYVIILSEGKLPMIYRSNMDPRDMAQCAVTIQHDAFSQFRVIQYSPEDFDGVS